MKIEQGIPVPPRCSGRRNKENDSLWKMDRSSKWPFAMMNVGDSFLVTDWIKFQSVQACASAHGKKYNKKFYTRFVEEGMRVWRVE